MAARFHFGFDEIHSTAGPASVAIMAAPTAKMDDNTEHGGTVLLGGETVSIGE